MTITPNFFIVGSAKAGTTSLVDYLDQNSEIYFSKVKEPFFFVHRFGVVNLNEYLSLFKNANGYKIIGEASTGYLYDTNCAQRIKSFSSDAKILISLRNPIDMAFSLWKFMSMVGNEMDSFSDAIHANDKRKQKIFAQKAVGWPENYLYLDRGKYFHQVKAYKDVFPEEQVKVIIFEEWVKNPKETLLEIFDFLEVGIKTDITLIVKNRGGKPRFKFMQHVLQRKYPFLRSVIPLQYRNRLRLLVRDLNRTESQQSVLDPDFRIKLASYFKQDVISTGRLIKKKLWDEYYS